MAETPSNPGASRDPVAELLAQFLDLRNAGENPDLEVFLERCPAEMRGELRQAIQLMGDSAMPQLLPNRRRSNHRHDPSTNDLRDQWPLVDHLLQFLGETLATVRR